MKKCSTVPLSKLTDDTFLDPFQETLKQRADATLAQRQRFTEQAGSLTQFANGHAHYGLHRTDSGWVFREWAPNATAIWLVGDCSGWQEQEAFRLERQNAHGDWEVTIPAESLWHGSHYRLKVCWDNGHGERLPAYARRVVQDNQTHLFSAQVWDPPAYQWVNTYKANRDTPLYIYEAHVGMAVEEARVGTYVEFRDHILPRVVKNGYNAIQLMAIMEHPYYGSFGYQVGSFFAPSSRFGTPEELKSLVDTAHGMGLTVIMDLVHSHAVINEVEGLGRFDGTRHQYFHEGERGEHPAWNSCCFDYGKSEVQHFLLSNCKYWLDEFHFDGFRFDGITSMLYHNHGLGENFTNYGMYFDGGVDNDALVYLALANTLIHELRPDALTIAEDMSGMPGLGATPQEGGCGFDYRLAMGMPDMWFKQVRKVPDEQWRMDHIFHELTNRRSDERVICYVESHDQALVGDKTMIFELVESAMYHDMHIESKNIAVDRGIALHKMIRLATMASSGHGYLTFMGNEFGHPEWIDFPREGNNWSYQFARRQWSLSDNPDLRYRFLGEWDKAIVHLLQDHGLPNGGTPECRWSHDDDKVLAFERCNLVFVFNFHASLSHVDYAIELPKGTYKLLQCSDDTEFGGQGRVEALQTFTTAPPSTKEPSRHVVRLYLPARTSFVLVRS
jgi:1,4-alpha-glucan branching enzyme